MNLALPLNIEYKKTLNYLIIAYAFCLPLSKAGISFFELLLIIVWLFEGNLKEKYLELKQNYFILSIFIFLCFSTLSIFWGNDVLFGLDYIRKYWHLLVIPVIYTSLNLKYINYIFFSFLCGIFISSMLSYLIFFEVLIYKNILASDPSPFMDHTNFSIYLAFSAFIVIYKIFCSYNKQMKILYSILFIFIVISLFINIGRTGQIAFLICLVVFGLLISKDKIKIVFLMILFSSILIVGAYNMSPSFEKRMNTTINDIRTMFNEKSFNGAISARVGLWITGTKAFIQEPIIGTGVGNEAKHAQEDIKKYKLHDFYHTRTEKYVDFHNAFIQYAVQIGSVGLMLFLIILYTLLKQKIKIQVYRNLNVIFVFLFVLLSFVGSSLHIMASMVLFALFGGIFSAISKIENERR